MNKLDFNRDWSFRKQGEERKQLLTLPHDAMIHEARSASVSNSGHGYFPGGVYVYEKRFITPSDWEGKQVLAEFEGVYKNATVSLNGRKLCFHPYGYTSFVVELADLRIGEENILTVIADNSKTPNSRWYTGSGIYRPVWLHVGGKDGVAWRGVKITTVSINPPAVRVDVKAGSEARVEILDGETMLYSGTSGEIALPGAQLWSDETPRLYTCRVTAGGDTVEERFGIREIRWSPKGLFINGKETLLRGGCVHHDSGILGAATYDESEIRRVRILKEQGFNAIRSSHNPASRAMVEACDALGIYLMDESFDMWYNRKNKFDYGCDFEENWEKDLTELVERDYNHPSVILYSIGNEVAEPHEQKGLDYAKKQIELVHRLDSSRPVTCGVNLMIIGNAAKGKGIYQDGEQKTGGKQKKEGGNASLMFNIMASIVGTGMNKAGNSKKVDAVTSPFCDMLDIVGYNYGSGRYPLEAKAHPDRVIVGSETFPQDICKNWQMVKEYPYLIGDFMWTSWDYLGEAGLGAWSYDGTMPFNRPYPWLLSGSGVIDINGVPDASCKYAAVVWGRELRPVIGVRPFGPRGRRAGKSVWRGTNAVMSWSWQGCEGRKTIVEVYSQAVSVELLLNGRSLGKKKTKAFQAQFRVPYAPGILRAVAYGADGRELGRTDLVTAKSAEIHVQPEKLNAKPGEIIYVPVSIGDGKIVESHADRKLSVSVEGGELLAFGSANPCTEERFDSGEYTTHLGRALAIVRVRETTVVSVTDGKQTAARKISVS